MSTPPDTAAARTCADAARNTASATSMARAPLMRSMPTPASPGAVAMAAIVSACIVLILSLMAKEMPLAA